MTWRSLDLDGLRTLMAIVDHGGFSLAAEQLGRSQSAVSLQLKRLESSLGQTLVKRVQGRVDGPTAEGLALLGYARQLLRLNDEACAAISCRSVVGSLRIGLPEELMESAFAPALQAFRTRYPLLRLSLQADPAARVRAALTEGRLDLAVYKDCATALPPTARLLRDEPLCWVAGEAYRDSLGLVDDALPLALFGENCVFRLAATAALAQAGYRWQVHYHGSSLTGLRHALRHGLGLGLLPASQLGDGLVAVQQCAGKILPPLPRARLLAETGSGAGAPGEAWIAALAVALAPAAQLA
ncbi:LysR substrate-binding domain-containing protein [Dechloromonas sp. ZY10]|uniref:LysR substrate-binding domain-containing protein n=1 Tax=Dechloromonas aquae TaxID=2664436 RepID=UPI003526FA6B